MRTLLSVLALVALVAGLVWGWRWLERNVGPIARHIERWRQRLVASTPVRKFKERYPRLSRFVAARFARGEYLGLHLTIGFLITLVGLVVFSIITNDVIREAPLVQFDLEVYKWLRERATLYGYAGWSVLTSLGNGSTLTVVGVGVAAILALRRHWIVLGGWAAALLGSGLLDGLLKLAIQRPRPEAAFDFLTRLSWSFPSGHSMASLVTYGMVAYLLVLALPGRKGLQIGVVCGFALLILAIGFSRLYLGVHYFSDVVGGFSAGALWLSACMSGLEVVRRMKGRTPVTP